MHRIATFTVAMFLLLATLVPATPPTPQPPLEVRLAKMEVIVVGLLKVEGEGPDRNVSLEISHVLKRPHELKKLQPDAVLKVTPRPAGFSDQGGKGVWSLDMDEEDGKLIVSKYEFITYGRNHEEIKKALDAIAANGKAAQSAD